MTKHEIKVIFLSSIGEVVGFYDFMIFISFADIISLHFFSGSVYARYLYIFSIFAIGYLVRPLGGVIFGHFGDRLGRKNTFFTSILLISSATFLMAFIPGCQSIGIISPVVFVVLRIIQGFAMGGELPGATTFVYESMPLKRKVFGTSFILSGTNLGLLISSLLVAILYMGLSLDFLTNSIIWRIPFLLGGIAGLILGFMRYNLETPDFKALLKTDQIMRFPVVELFRKVPGSVLKGIFIYFALIYSTIIMVTLPGFLSSYLKYFNPEETSLVNSITILFLVILIPVFGYLVDKFKIDMFLFYSVACLLLALSASVVFSLIETRSLFCLFTAYLFFITIYSLVQSTELPILSKLFPPIVRYTGLGAVMNIGAIGLGFVPLFSIFLYKYTGNFLLLIIISTISCLVSSICAFCLYKNPIDENKLSSYQFEISKIYSLINEMPSRFHKSIKLIFAKLNNIPIDQETKDYIINDIERSVAQLNEEQQIPFYDNEGAEVKNEIESAGNFIKEYTRKVLNAKDERERLILSKLMHLEYDAVIHKKPVTEARRERIENEVDMYLKQNQN